MNKIIIAMAQSFALIIYFTLGNYKKSKFIVWNKTKPQATIFLIFTKATL